jgi:hypothetical protein
MNTSDPDGPSEEALVTVDNLARGLIESLDSLRFVITREELTARMRSGH